MKHIKTYKIFESNSFDLFKKYVNLELIEDLKSISLPYIDEGFSLLYYVYVFNTRTNRYDHIFTGHFNHDKDDIHSNDGYSYYSMILHNNDNGIFPKFKYVVDLGTTVSEYHTKTKHLKDIVRQLLTMYPTDDITYTF